MGGAFGIRMARGKGDRGAKEMSDVRRGWCVGLWGWERAEMHWPRKRGGEPGLFVALFRGGVELWSLWSSRGGEGNGRLRCAAGVRMGGRAGASVGVYLLVWDGARV